MRMGMRVEMEMKIKWNSYSIIMCGTVGNEMSILFSAEMKWKKIIIIINYNNTLFTNK